MKDEQRAAINTDKVIYREPISIHGEGYEPRVWVTKDGSIGMEHYGTCVVKSIEGWILAIWGEKPSLKWLRDEEFKQKNAFIHRLMRGGRELVKAGRGLQYAGKRHDMEPNIRFNGAVAEFNKLIETMKQTKNK